MINRDEIYHHGVSGMKWGKRNGPPYPLNAAGKASLAKQRKSSGRVSSEDTTEYGSSVKGKQKKNVTIVKDAKGKIKSITGKIDTNSKTKASKDDIKKLVTKYSAELMEEESIYGLDFEDDRVPKTVRDSFEYKRYKEAQEHYRKEFNKNPDSTEAVQAYERLTDAGHDLSRLVKNMNEAGAYRDKSEDTTEYGSILSKKKEKQKEADYSKMSDEEKTQAKQKAIREGNIREANANRNEYTDQELKAVKERFQLNSDVAKLSKATVKTGQQKAEELASKFETASKLTNAVANTAQNSIKIYNTLGAVAATLNGTDFEPIKLNGSIKNKNKANSDKKNKNKDKKNKNKGKDNTEMKGMPEKKSLMDKLNDYVRAKAAEYPVKSKPTQQSKVFESEMTKQGYKSDDNYSDTLMTKKAGGLSINVDKGNDVEFSEVSKNVKALEPKASQIKQDFVKKLKSEGYGKLSSKEPSLYITDTLAEVGVWGDDGHEYSTYVDLKTGKLDKYIMMNG